MENQSQRGAVSQGIVFGMLIVGVGVLLLLGNLGILRVRDLWTYWPLILVVLGIGKLLDSEAAGERTWGALMVIIGGVLMLDHLGYFFIDVKLLWPALVILFGLAFLWRVLQRRDGSDGAPPSSMADFQGWAIFGGGKRRVVAQDFRSGEVVAIFGGYEIDLTDAQMAGPKAVVSVNAMFGGVEIRVPETWSVSLDGIAILGGYEDKTRRSSDPANAKTLVIKGCAIFGGVEVKN